jgi:hypothetical protein
LAGIHRKGRSEVAIAKRRTTTVVPTGVVLSKLFPQSLEPALVNHLVKLLPVRIEFEAPLADLVLMTSRSLLRISVQTRSVMRWTSRIGSLGTGIGGLHYPEEFLPW